MNLNISNITKLKSMRQTLAVSGSNFFVMGIGFFINVLLARAMGLTGFGLYSFAFAVFNFVAIFMEFGFYSTAAKVLADEKDEYQERKLLGSIFIVYVFISVIFSALMYVIGYFIDDFFVDKIGSIIRYMAFSGYAYTASFFMEWVLKGCNKIYLLSQYNILGKILHCVILLWLWHQKILFPENILMSYAIAIGISVFICYAKMKPVFSDCRNMILWLYNSNKIYGWPQYLGRIVDVGSANIDRVLVSYFVDAKSLGLYSIAVSFASVVNVLGRSIGIVQFKKFAEKNVISNSIVMAVRYVTLLSVALVLVTSYFTIHFILGNDYQDVFIYILILILGTSSQSMYSLYISWLSSHGCSKDLRDANFCMSFVNIFSAFVLTYFFGIIGTCMAFSIGCVFSLYMYFVIYLKKCER